MSTPTLTRATRAAIRAHFREFAGWRATFLPAETGLPVTVYDGIAQGLDPDGGRWNTVCELHGHIISHETLALARAHATDPLGWCECCMGNHTEVCEHQDAAAYLAELVSA